LPERRGKRLGRRKRPARRPRRLSVRNQPGRRAQRAETPRPQAEAPFRIGCGWDQHPVAAGRALVLGGVRVRGAPGLLGHSDADVLAHAVCDALLGALGLEDLGRRFPDTDPRHRGRSSLFFLRAVMRDVRRRGFRIGNLDAILIAERPRLRPHLDAMRKKLARTLSTDPSNLSVKAKRGEGLGAIGRGEGMAAQAVVLLVRAAAEPGGTRR
jgi:2-C-methyl-D-erythritol 2,4-cyclodiphosphate synthase